MSYGNHKGHSERWWRGFIKACHVLGLANKNLQSIIKKSRHYGIQGIICETEYGRNIAEQLLMSISQEDSELQVEVPRHSGKHTPQKSNMVRSGKGSHGLTVIKKLNGAERKLAVTVY